MNLECSSSDVSILTRVEGGSMSYLTTHTSLSPIRRGFAPGFVNDKSTNNDLQNSTQKTEEKKIQTPQGTGDNLRCSEKVSS